MLSQNSLSKICTAIVALLFPLWLQAQNPYLPLWEFIPDGEPYVFEDPDCPGKYRVYVYGSHDTRIKDYCGLDQVVWSCPVEDLTKWRYDGVIFESVKGADGKLLNADGKGDLLYAPDVAEIRDEQGKKTYYLYPNTQRNGRRSMVAKSDRPDGPFTVCNWDPSDPGKTTGPVEFDPGILVDDDGRVYGYWGFQHSYAAELDPSTMSTIKPGTQVHDGHIANCNQDHLYKFFEASSIRKIKDKYVFIYSRYTNDGEWGLPKCSYTLAYCYSNSPFGPWTYGGTIIDGRGVENIAPDKYIATAYTGGNTHGSICEINGQWWVFYHRHTGTSEYSRQANVAPINVEVLEGADGYVRISQAEFNSEGFQTGGLDPFKCYQAGIACYFTGPVTNTWKFPYFTMSGSYPQPVRQSYDGTSDPFDPAINHCPMVNNTSGSVIGYKYFNFSKTYGQKRLKLAVSYIPEGISGKIEVFLDRPSEKEGGVCLGSMDIKGGAGHAMQRAEIGVEPLKHYNGKHALFLVFSSEISGRSICELHDIQFCR